MTEVQDQPAAQAVAQPRRWPSLVVIGLLLTVSVATMVGRHPELPTAQFLNQRVSTLSLPDETAGYAEEALLVPFAAFLVVVVRLFLGIRMLGPFRPILLALAFQFTGFLVGVGFMAAVLFIVAMLRPRLKHDWLPYSSRLPLLLIVVVLLQVALLLVAAQMGWKNVGKAAFFPIVVLCMTADGFARVLSEEGRGAAIWRGITTVLIAMAIYGAYHLPGVELTLVEFPELIFAEIAGILFVSRFCSFRLFEGWNPIRKGQPRVAESDED